MLIIWPKNGPCGKCLQIVCLFFWCQPAWYIYFRDAFAGKSFHCLSKFRTKRAPGHVGCSNGFNSMLYREYLGPQFMTQGREQVHRYIDVIIIEKTFLLIFCKCPWESGFQFPADELPHSKLIRCTYVLEHHKENGIIEYSM